MSYLEDSDGTETSSPAAPPTARKTRLWARIGASWDWLVVLSILGGYAALITYFSNLRAENFFTSAWDLGINQQLLWTTAHGQLLYETPDLAFYGAHSFLQVHSTYVAVLIAPIYAAWPNPLTLFVIQSSVFAASGIPLYFLARGTLARKELALAVAVLYLASFAVISGLMYDFHWEAFLPLEFFTFFVLVERRKFALALVPFAFGTLTLEVFPFLAGAVAVLLLYERAAALRFRGSHFLGDREFRMGMALVGISLIAYALVRIAQYDLVPGYLAVPSVTGGGSSAPAALLSIGANFVTLPHSLAYWALMLVTLAFLPLLSPRHLILSAPWFFYSVFVSPEFSAHFGDSPALIAFPALTVAAIFGLAELERRDWSELSTLIVTGALLGTLAFLAAVALLPRESVYLLRYTAGPWFWAPAVVAFGVTLAVLLGRRVVGRTPPALRRLVSRRIRRTAVPTVVAAVVVTILVFDATMSPFNPTNFQATPIPGYEFQFSQSPTAAQMPWLLSYLPSDAQVLASDRLFPYVANNPDAWAIPWFVISPQQPVPNFPFSPGNLPDYILADSQEFPLVPQFLQSAVFNASEYGLVAYIYAAGPPGTIYLFERGFAGSTAARTVSTFPATLQYTWSNLSVGVAGKVESDPNSSFGQVINSTPVGPVNGTASPVWYGPYATLVPGNYTVTYRLEGGSNSSLATMDPIGYLDATWTGIQNNSSFYRYPVTAAELSPHAWTRLQYSLELRYPYPDVELRGYLDLVNGRSIGWIKLDWLEISSMGP